VAISGGAIFPVIAAPVAATRGTPYSFCVMVALSVFGALFPLYMILTPQARAQVDPQKKRVHTLPINEDGTTKRSRGGWVQKLRRVSAKPAAEHVENGGKSSEKEAEAGERAS
jgi:hypothetical protein